MGVDYVDIFYSHRFDPDTPLEETMGALDSAVRAGKALYVGISSYSGERTREAAAILRELGTPLLIHQPSYSMLNRWIEEDLLDVLGETGVGCIAFSPLAQGMLTSKYLDGIPAGSRASQDKSLSPDLLTEQTLGHVRALNELAQERGQSLAQMALAWALRDRAGHLGADRREQRRPARRQPRRAGQPRVQRRRAGPDRPARRRRRHQPVGEVGGVLTGYRNGELSHWLHAAGRTAPTRAPLPGAGQADVVIVGAGLTGLWAAHALRRLAPQLSVTLLEAEQVGFGASGRNGGWLSHLVPGNRARYAAGPGGVDGAVRLQAAMLAGIDEVLAVCRREGIEADLHRGGNLVVATTPAGLHRLRDVRDADRRYGLTGPQSELLDARRTRDRVDVHGAVGGLLHPMVARLDPAKLVTGLANAVQLAGAVIHERTRVHTVAPGGVRTDRGDVAAGSVLVCTEGYGGPLLGARSLIPVNSSMIVTEPLSERDWAAHRLGRTGVPQRLRAHLHLRPAHGRRPDRGRRARPAVPLQLAIEASGQTHPHTVRELLARLNGYFPGVPFEVAHAWSGVLGVTRDWCADRALRRRPRARAGRRLRRARGDRGARGRLHPGRPGAGAAVRAGRAAVGGSPQPALGTRAAALAGGARDVPAVPPGRPVGGAPRRAAHLPAGPGSAATSPAYPVAPCGEASGPGRGRDQAVWARISGTAGSQARRGSS